MSGPRRSIRSVVPLADMSVEQADATREIQALLSWASNLLKKRELSVSSLINFSDGLILVHLVEIAFKGKINGFNPTPKTVFHKLGNITATLEFLKSQGVTFVSVDSDMICQGKVKALTIVLWSILRQLTLNGLKALNGNKKDAGGAAASNSIKSSLLSWCNNIVSNSSSGTTTTAPVNDFGESFQDGKIFTSIIQKLVPGSDTDFAALASGDATAALALAFKIAEEKLGVPILLNAEDFSDASTMPEEQTVIDYVCLLLSAFQRIKESEASAGGDKEMEEELLKKQEELSSNLESVQKQLSDTARERDAAVQQATASQSQVQSLRTELETAQAALQAEKQAFAAHERQSQASLESLNTMVLEATTQTTAVQNELEAAQQTIEQLRAEVLEAQASSASNSADGECRLRAAIDKQRQIHEAARDSEAALQATIAQLNESLNNAVADISALQVKVKKVSTKLEASEAALQQTRSELSDVLQVQKARSRGDIATKTAALTIAAANRRPGAAPVAAGAESNVGASRLFNVNPSAAALERKTMQNYLDSFEVNTGLMNKKRPDSFFGGSAQTRYFELTGRKLMYYDNSSKVEFKGDINLTSFHLIDMDRAQSLAATNLKEFSILLEPLDKTKDKPAEFVPVEMHEDGVKEILHWAKVINSRILILKYLDSVVDKEGIFRGVSEIIDFVQDEKQSDFVLCDRPAGDQLREAFAAFLPALITRQNLTLSLCNVGLTLPSVLQLNQVMTRSQSFRSLKLTHNNLMADSASALAKGFSRNASLTALDLDFNQIGDEGLTALGAALADQPMLKQLSLRANRIGDAGAVALVEGLKASAQRHGKAHAMPKLELAENSIGDAGAAAIASLLEQNGTITEVDLANNSVTDTGIAPLAAAIKSIAPLSTLDLSGNHLSSASLELLADMIRNTKHEMRLNLGENLIGRVGIGAFTSIDQPMEFRAFQVVRSQLF